MELNTDIIEVNGKKYVLADSVKNIEFVKGDEVIVRTFSAGVHVGSMVLIRGTVKPNIV